MNLEVMLQVLRKYEWMVAVHNDYRQNGSLFTFWLFTHPSGRYIKGEGASDLDAVTEAYEQAGLSIPQST